MTHPAVLPLEVETWRPIPGHSGYEVSGLGRVRSMRHKHPGILRSSPGPCGFRTVQLSDRGEITCNRVGSLVTLAWVGPRPSGAEVRRLDGDTLNDRADNVAYGTIEEVQADHAARARREEEAGAPTHCAYGHRFADSWLGDYGNRYCPECDRCKPPVTQCSDCGADFQQKAVTSGRYFKRCEPCRLRRKLRVSYCIDCGETIRNTGPGPMAQRCVPHKRLAHRAASERYERKTRRNSGYAPPTSEAVTEW